MRIRNSACLRARVQNVEICVGERVDVSNKGEVVAEGVQFKQADIRERELPSCFVRLRSGCQHIRTDYCNKFILDLTSPAPAVDAPFSLAPRTLPPQPRSPAESRRSNPPLATATIECHSSVAANKVEMREVECRRWGGCCRGRRRRRNSASKSEAGPQRSGGNLDRRMTRAPPAGLR